MDMNTFRFCVIESLLFLITMSSVSCSDMGKDMVKNNEFKEIVMTKSESELTAEVNSFAFDLMDEIVGMPCNDYVCSPFSIASGLSMIANGAEGITKESLLDVLGYKNFSIKEVNGYYAKISEALKGADKTVDFFPANAMWYDEALSIKDDFTSSLSRSYSAAAHNVDFGKGNATDEINRWYKNHTEGKIDKMFDHLNPDVNLILTNALCFDAAWKTPSFDTKASKFNHGDGTTSDVVMLFDDLRAAAYNHTDDFQCLELEYGNGAFVLDLILPREGLSLSEASEIITDEYWETDLSKLYYNINVKMEFPKFHISSKDDMTEILSNIGLSDLFSRDADFSGITDTDLDLAMFSHACTIDVTEEGTKVVSSSGAVFEDPIAPLIDPDATYSFIADRPFMFFIREKSTGVILFMGKKA